MKKFKTESKKMLDLMINSIYTNREIFIRELVSNASDAIDKAYYKSLSSGESGKTREDYAIEITLDKENRTFKISDNGIGMTESELENNLGTIAKSGSLEFKKKLAESDDISIIGQFGVGFYSAFMIAKRVEVVSKAVGSDKAYKWESEGAEGYEISEFEKSDFGTEITLYLKDDSEEEKFGEFLEEWTIRRLIKKYSDYVRYPIKMEVTKHKTEGEGEDEKQVSYSEVETLNSMTPLWKKQRSEVSDEQYNEFYKDKFGDYEDPIRVITASVEGVVDYKALLYIPRNKPYNYYTKAYEKGLMLYTNSVLITDKCADLLPDYFNFVKGVCDSQLTLNISRETVQQNRQLKAIAQSIEKKIKSELLSMLKNDRADYEHFFKNFGLSLKYGIYSSFGANSEKLSDLLLFKLASSGKYATLDEYVDNMKEGQTHIIYATGKSVEGIKALPQTEILLEKGYDILCLTDDVDEFCIKMLRTFKEKEFKSIESGLDVELESAEIDKELEQKILKVLEGKIFKVKGSKSLKNHAVCLSSEGEISIEMEKVFAAMPDNDESTKAQKVLEINIEHPIYQKMLETSDEEKLNKIISVLYQQSRLIQGLAVEDATKLTEDIVSLMID
ncbi:MAG: molecular chaperone HtpG [Clostridia bacterium]|nr:molecular chaperone HtpG [Clostridia bacterium]